MPLFKFQLKKGLTHADINYKFLGEIERDQQNPSFGILTKIALALGVDLPEFYRFDHETADRKEIENHISSILKDIPNEDLSRIFLIFQALSLLKSKFVMDGTSKEEYKTIYRVIEAILK